MLKETSKLEKNLSTGKSFDKKNVRIIKKTIIGSYISLYNKGEDEDAVTDTK
jgi:hypothetical protein